MVPMDQMVVCDVDRGARLENNHPSSASLICFNSFFFLVFQPSTVLVLLHAAFISAIFRLILTLWLQLGAKYFSQELLETKNNVKRILSVGHHAARNTTPNALAAPWLLVV